MRKSIRKLGLESLAEDLAVAPVETVEVAADAVPETVVVLDTADNELLAVAAAQSAAADTSDAIDELAAAATRLSDIRTNIEATLPNGGLTQGEAVAYQCATDAVVADLGVQQVLPAMEHFGGSKSRMQATTASMEALDGVIGKVMKRAGELLESLFKRIGELAGRVVEYFTSNESRLKKMRDVLRGKGSAKGTVSLGKDEAAMVAKGGRFEASVVRDSLSFLTTTLKASTDITKKDLNDLANVSVDSTILVGSTSKNGDVVSSNAVAGYTFKETICGKQIENYSFEVVEPSLGDGKTDVSVTGQELIVAIDALLGLDKKALTEAKGFGTSISTAGKVMGVASKLTGDDADKSMAENVRDYAMERSNSVLKVVGVYNEVIRVALSVISKGTSELTSAKAAALPAPSAA